MMSELIYENYNQGSDDIYEDDYLYDSSEGIDPDGYLISEKSRIKSLDLARGVLLIFSVFSASLVISPLPEPFTHSPWYGITFLDLIFPTFVCMSGIGFAFAHAKGVNPLIVLRRTVVLIVLGFLYNYFSHDYDSFADTRWTGVLQLYGVLSLFQGLAHLVLTTWRRWMVWTLFLAALLTAIYHVWPIYFCNMASLTNSCNPSLTLDTALLPTDHIYGEGRYGHDPEGLVATLGAFLTMSVGTTLGKLFLKGKDETRRPYFLVALWLCLVAGVGAASYLYVMPFKRLWTPSFAILTSLIAVVLVVIFWLIYDSKSSRGLEVPLPLKPLEALGRNSLLVYFGSHMLINIGLLQEGPDGSPWPVYIANTYFSFAPLYGFAAFNVLAWVLLALILHYYRVYIKA